MYQVFAEAPNGEKVLLEWDKHTVWNDRPYVDLHTVYPKEMIECETYAIDTFELSEEEVKMDKVRNLFRGQGWLTHGLQANFPYVRLKKKGEGIMMSDTPMERNSNRDFVKNANGDVLIFGLGLGLVILPLLKAQEVTSITVVELHQDLIDLVTPILKKHDLMNKLTVVQGDCFEYHKEVPKGKKWNCIYGDIWISICSENYEEMKVLTKNFKHMVNRNNPKWMLDHWLKDYCKHEYLEEKRHQRKFQAFMW